MATRNINYCFMDENLKLYETLKEIWWRVLGLEEIVWDEHYGCCCFNNRSDGMQYTCAYIGPSATRAYQMGIADLTVGTAIKECRTIGGHMIWPRHTANINTSKGKAACDRIDITLLEIKDFYESNFSETAAFSQAIRNALVKDKEWFKQFMDFVGFSNNFLLTGSFVDTNYQVVELAAINPENAFIPETEEKYRRFIQENTNAVKRRNKLIDRVFYEVGESIIQNMQTNKVNVFDQTKRKVKCIANEHDYLGDGTVFREDKLEVGKQYTFIKGEVRSYGSMVHLEELPNKYGFMSYLFEELQSYDETILKENYRKWLNEKLEESYYRKMGRDQSVAVFKDTERLCKSEKQLVESIRKSIAGQKLILESENIERPKLDIYADPAAVVVSKKRTFEAASQYKENKVAVHNFASASNPGGGVVKGSSAQEECLCRCSGLYFCLNTPEMWTGFYTPHRNAHDPIHNDDIIYTPEIMVFKTDENIPKLMDAADWYKVNVITCAAPNLRIRPGNSYNTGDGKKAAKIKDKDLLALHEKRLRRILDVAVSEGNDTIILGAFGCGAFENNPEVVAMASRNVIKEYLHAFKTIEYAIYCSPRDERNFTIFERVLRKVV